LSAAVFVFTGKIDILVFMSQQTVRAPSILLPYTGPCLEPNTADIVLAFRPETNGVRFESTLLQVIYNNPHYKKNIIPVYLANLPGDFIVKNRIIEQHYAVKIKFARNAKTHFSDTMKEEFESHFHVSFDTAIILGGFEALEVLQTDAERLFSLWVDGSDFETIRGQTIKRYEDLFIVNSDIPAVLHRNNTFTDIAVMIFRSYLCREDFHDLLSDIREKFIQQGIMNAKTPLNKALHFSKGPFEQLLDGIGYIYTEDRRHIPYRDISFFLYLLNHGMSQNYILTCIRQPIVMLDNGREINLLNDTFDLSYEDAYRMMCRISRSEA